MADSAKESAYQRRLIDRIESLLPDCFIIKLDPDQYQGIPDLLILFEDKWAALEVKVSEQAPVQPNQEYYVDLFNKLSFAAFIFPDIEDDVLAELVEKMGGE